MISILPSINNTSLKLFHSNNKVDLAPTSETSQTPVLGKTERTPVQLGLQAKLFSNAGESVPIILSPSGAPYLYANSNGAGIVSLQDAYSGESVATMERVDNIFLIYSNDDDTKTPIAQVTQHGKVLKVVLQNGDSEPSFTVHKIIQNRSRLYQTKYIVKQNGKQVASSRYGHLPGNSYMLTVAAGTDPCLMTCLAAIVDEIYSE